MIKEITLTTLLSIKSNIAFIITTIVGLLSPIVPILLLVFLFVLADTGFGLWAAGKLNQKRTSTKLFAIVSKLVMFSALVILTYLLDIFILGEFLLKIVDINMLATKVAALVAIANESYSIDEKLRKVTSKGLLFHFKRLVAIGKKIKSETKDLTEENK